MIDFFHILNKIFIENIYTKLASNILFIYRHTIKGCINRIMK